MTIHDPWKHIPIAHVDTYGRVLVADELIKAIHHWRVVRDTIRVYTCKFADAVNKLPWEQRQEWIHRVDILGEGMYE